MNTTSQPKDIVRLIEALPAKGLPVVLAAVITEVLKKGVYDGKDFIGIVQAIEKRVRTGQG
jgi:hypothetical protein